MKMKKFIGAAAAMAVAGVLTVGAAAETYNAYIGFQTPAYSFRNAWNEANYGRDSKNGELFNTAAIVWGGNDPETFPQYEKDFNDDIGGYAIPVTYTDAQIDKDGTYKVGITGFDWELDKAVGFNMLFVSTDIPYDKDNLKSVATITDVKLLFDGVEQFKLDEAIIDEEEGKKSGFTRIDVTNDYNDTAKELGFHGTYPTNAVKTVEIEFTVSGLPTDEPVDEPTDEPVDEPTDEPTEEPTDEPTEEPTTGDSTKPSTDTGVEGVAAVAGVALLAAGAVVIAKKRK